MTRHHTTAAGYGGPGRQLGGEDCGVPEAASCHASPNQAKDQQHLPVLPGQVSRL